MEQSMESIWNGMDHSMHSIKIPWNPYGIVWTEQSIWNRNLSENLPSPIWIPCSFHGPDSMDSMEQSMEWDFIRKFTKSHMDSMFIPWTRFHGFHPKSMWNQYLGLAKDGFINIYIVYIN